MTSKEQYLLEGTTLNFSPSSQIFILYIHVSMIPNILKLIHSLKIKKQWRQSDSNKSDWLFRRLETRKHRHITENQNPDLVYCIRIFSLNKLLTLLASVITALE